MRRSVLFLTEFPLSSTKHLNPGVTFGKAAVRCGNESLIFYTDACGSSMQLNVSCRARETHLSLLFVEGSRNVVGVKVSPQKSWRRSFFHVLRVDTTYHIYPTFCDMHLESCCGESREGVACANTLAQGVAFQEPSVPKDRHRSAASHSLGRFSLLKANLQNFCCNLSGL